MKKTNEIQNTIIEVKAEMIQLTLNFDEKVSTFVNENADTFNTIKEGAKLQEKDAIENYVNKNFDSATYHAALNKVADFASVLRDNGKFKSAGILMDYRNHFNTLGRLEAHAEFNNIEVDSEEKSSEVKKFEVGKTYKTTSNCDSNCIYTFKIVKRTEKTVTTINKHGKQKLYRVRIIDGVEKFSLGRYSLASIISASDEERQAVTFDVEECVVTPEAMDVAIEAEEELAFEREILNMVGCTYECEEELKKAFKEGVEKVLKVFKEKPEIQAKSRKNLIQTLFLIKLLALLPTLRKSAAEKP